MQTHLRCHFKRRYDRLRAWLLTIELGPDHVMAHGTAYPHARAVVDDFGNLVIVGGWF